MIHVFIINTKIVEPEFGMELRRKMKERQEIQSFVFNTMRQGMEREIAQRIIRFFDGEVIRFYSCGGSGTMRNIVDGAIHYKQAEFAFIPCGATNDFLKVFGKDMDAFRDVDAMMEGKTVKIDVLRSNYGYALNTISYGIDTLFSQTHEKLKHYDIFGEMIPRLLAYGKALLGMTPQRLLYSMGGPFVNANVSELILGNGNVLGGNLYFSQNADYRDGKLEYLIAENMNPRNFLKTMGYMKKKDHKEVNERTQNGSADFFSLKSESKEPLALNLDGEIVQGGEEWSIEVIRQKLTFVVPKGVIV